MLSFRLNKSFFILSVTMLVILLVLSSFIECRALDADGDTIMEDAFDSEPVSDSVSSVGSTGLDLNVNAEDTQLSL